MKKSAYISSDGKYRYVLRREWGFDVKNHVAFVMLNPSTADARIDDPTIRRCIGFAQSWGYDGLSVVNLFAYRATNPKNLMRAADPIGPDNDEWIRDITLRSKITVAAWGTKGNFLGRDQSCGKFLPFLYCLELTKDGFPKHPLYVKSMRRPEIFGRIGGDL